MFPQNYLPRFCATLYVVPVYPSWLVNKAKATKMEKHFRVKIRWVSQVPLRITLHEQGGFKSTASSPRLRVWVILTDPESVREALWFSYSDSFQLNQLRLWEWEAVRVKYQGRCGHSAVKACGWKTLIYECGRFCFRATSGNAIFHTTMHSTTD